jgi:hypothetical protein
MRELPPLKKNFTHYKTIILSTLTIASSVFHAIILTYFYEFFANDSGEIFLLFLAWLISFIAQFTLYSFLTIFVRDWRIILIPICLSAFILGWVYSWSLMSIFLILLYIIGCMLYTLVLQRDIEDRLSFSFSSLSKGQIGLCVAMVALVSLTSYQGIIASPHIDKEYEVPQEALKQLTPIIKENIEDLMTEMMSEFGAGIAESQKQVVVDQAANRVESIITNTVNTNLPDTRFINIVLLVVLSILMVPVSTIFAFIAHIFTYVLLFILQKLGVIEKRVVMLEAQRFDW